MLGTDKQGRKEGRLNIQYPFGVTQSDCFASHLFLLNFVIAKDLKGKKDLRKAANKVFNVFPMCYCCMFHSNKDNDSKKHLLL